ncbi:MAG: polyribonucleotide nucleotidyltransferase [Myxococcales bacterium]
MMIRDSAVFGSSELTIETGRMAKQANGSVLVTHGDVVVLVTACASASEREGIDFFPLTVDYIEKTYSAGRIPGGYLKREGRLSNFETLTSRLIDRPIRPLFPDGFRCETQIIATVLSFDKQNDPAINAMNGASAALMLSDIPFAGPVAGVRVGRIEGQFIANPTYAERGLSDLDLLVAVGPSGIAMVEGEANFLPEAVIVDALEFAQKAARPVIDLQLRLREQAGKPKRVVPPPAVDEALRAQLRELVWDKIAAAIRITDKLARYAALDGIFADAMVALGPDLAPRKKELKGYYSDFKSDTMRNLVVQDGVRIDGRQPTDIRQITCEVGVLPRTHGSALFTRGETQALVTSTLGTSRDEQRMDTLLDPDLRKRFLLHYNFPPFSVGECRPQRGPSRRDIGHGYLAERGVERVLPTVERFPYTLRIVSEVLESNGSSSMATVCGASLALMDAGVPISGPISGIAMGLIQEGDKAVVLSDILGDEDHLGDMDFKVVGNREGVSSLQMDIKIEGLTRETMERALNQARDGRIHILEKMEEAIREPRADISAYAPRIFTVLINPERIRDLIGPGGKHIRGIQEATGVTIDVNDSGRVAVGAVDELAAQEAIRLIRGYTEEAEIGKTYLGKVIKTVDFGAFVEIMPGTEGLVHISELSDQRVARTEDVVREGDEVLVKVISIDRQGKIKLSRREALARKG